MPLNPPKFWWKPTPLSRTLIPLGWIYNKVVQWRLLWGKQSKMSVPVICVGNLTLGGSGKTPTTMVLANYLKKTGHTPHILSRGHGGKRTKTHRVMPGDTAKEVGDEPLLLSQHAPVWIGRNRSQSAQRAIAAGATVLLMDDGFQNPHIYKNFSLVVVDGSRGFGNGFVFPAGPLRESIHDGLKRADAALVVMPPTPNKLKSPLPISDVPVFYTTPTFSLSKKIKNCVAFAGIAYPERFFDAVSVTGTTIDKMFSFPDHHLFTEKELAKVHRAAQKRGVPLVTTEKDFVRLKEKDQQNMHTLKMVIDLPKDFLTFFSKKVKTCV